LATNGVDASIVVQCRHSLDETEEFLSTAAATPSVIGVVGWADLTDPLLGDCLARLRALPGGNKLVGIRHQVLDEADPDWLMRSSVQRGLAAVFAHPLLQPRRRIEHPEVLGTSEAKGIIE
jgi:L-fuconolactonase